MLEMLQWAAETFKVPEGVVDNLNNWTLGQGWGPEFPSLSLRTSR